MQRDALTWLKRGKIQYASPETFYSINNRQRGDYDEISIDIDVPLGGDPFSELVKRTRRCAGYCILEQGVEEGRFYMKAVGFRKKRLAGARS